MRRKAVLVGAVGALAVSALLCGVVFWHGAPSPTVTVQLPANHQEGYSWDLSVSPSGAFETVSTSYSPEGTGGIETFVLKSRQDGDSTVTFTCIDTADGRVDSTATYRFSTTGSTITQNGVICDISDKLMEPWEGAA